MNCTGRYSATAYAIGIYNLASGSWTEANATWNSMNAAIGAQLAVTSVGDLADYSWTWNGSSASPVNGVAVKNNASETDKTRAKNFASREAGSTGPRLLLDYYLPDMGNPANKWITSSLLLGPVGGNDINAQTYATDAGLTGDTDLYGNSTKTYGTKTWTAYNGNVSEDGFSNYAWDLRTTAPDFGENNCALFNLYVKSSAAASGCYLRCGSDDGVRLIVNGTVVGTDDLGRGWGREQSVFGPFSLNAGWNRVLIKVRNGTSGFGLKGVRFSNADATVWSGSTLTYAVDDKTAPTNPSGCTESHSVAKVIRNCFLRARRYSTLRG